MKLFCVGLSVLILSGCVSEASVRAMEQAQQAAYEGSLAHRVSVQQNAPTRTSPAAYVICEQGRCALPTPIY